MTYLFAILATLLFPAIVIALSPNAWVRAVGGWLLLGIGLLLIDAHVATPSPYDDDGVLIPPGVFEACLWIAGGLAVVAFVARWRSSAESLRRSTSPAALNWLRDCAIPLGLLLAAAGLHWLSNRLAGAQPSVAIHAAVIAVSILPAAAMIGLKYWRPGRWTTLQQFGLTIPAGIALLTIWDAHLGFDLKARAAALAADRPHCLMTYGGFEHRREARGGWDLSPLVNRRYGVWAASKGPVVTIREAEGIRQYRWFSGRWQAVSYGPPLCKPRGG
jgi:hypothetical protein